MDIKDSSFRKETKEQGSEGDKQLNVYEGLPHRDERSEIETEQDLHLGIN